MERAARGYERTDAKLTDCPAAAAVYAKGVAWETGDKPNATKALDCYIKAARLGSVPALYRQGLLLRDAQPAEALSLFEQAADRGGARGGRRLRGPSPSRQKASVRLYGLAARAGDGGAQAALARRYETDAPDQAFYWYRRAAANNCPEGLAGLGLCYLHGIGIERDAAQAVLHLTRAAEQNVSRALLALADCYRMGTGVSIDSDREKELRDRAASPGCR